MLTTGECESLYHADHATVVRVLISCQLQGGRVLFFGSTKSGAPPPVVAEYFRITRLFCVRHYPLPLKKSAIYFSYDVRQIALSPSLMVSAWPRKYRDLPKRSTSGNTGTAAKHFLFTCPWHYLPVVCLQPPSLCISDCAEWRLSVANAPGAASRSMVVAPPPITSCFEHNRRL